MVTYSIERAPNIQAMKYLKKPIPSQVTFAQSVGTLQTLEGPVSYLAGDALMMGVKGERWPISRDNFEANYSPISPTIMGRDGLYLKKNIPISARQTESVEFIALENGKGKLRAQVGDWIVTAPDGHQWVVADDLFQLTYSPEIEI